ncbi:MAG: glycerol kinase GlpK [Acidobacteria bacterium]|nr:glycerol kinase GlpK [Acidobacteriota bacterium]
MGRYVMAIDQGTSSTKAMIVDEDGRIVTTTSSEVTQSFPRPGWVEHDPEEIWRGVLETTRRALSFARVDASQLAAVGITNQRETTVVWERDTGRALYPAIVWQDRRTASTCAALQGDGVGDWVRARTGLRIDPYFSATKVAWILDHVDGLRARAARGEVAAGTIDSWLLWKLTGGRVHATDPTNASRTLLMDLTRVAWDEELCDLFTVPTAVLGRIATGDAPLAESDADVWGSPVPITSMLGDQQAALLAHRCVSPGQTKNTYGTGSFVLQHTGAVPLTASASLIATAASTPPRTAQQYALEGSIFATGAAVQWLRDGLGIIESADETQDLAASLDDNGDVWFVPALSGLGAPHWDPGARGLLIGVTRGTTRAHVARAALESIAYQTREVVDAMNAQSGHPLRELQADGGATRNAWLMQFQSDVLGVPVVVSASAEATLWGAASAAGRAGRLWREVDGLPAAPGGVVRYEPAMSDDQRDDLQQRWASALARSRSWAT